PILLTEKKARKAPVAEPVSVKKGRKPTTQPRRAAAKRPAPVVHRGPANEAAQARKPPKPQPAGDRPIMLRLLDVVDQIRAASDRDGVATAMLDFLSDVYTRVAFFVVKKGAVTTWAARGPVQMEALRALAIPLDAPSLLRDVISSRTAHCGPLGTGPVNNLLKVALGQLPEEIVLSPISIRDRVVGVLYSDGPKQSVP